MKEDPWIVVLQDQAVQGELPLVGIGAHETQAQGVQRAIEVELREPAFLVHLPVDVHLSLIHI